LLFCWRETAWENALFPVKGDLSVIPANGDIE
jgi:hypothetical protein